MDILLLLGVMIMIPFLFVGTYLLVHRKRDRAIRHRHTKLKL